MGPIPHPGRTQVLFLLFGSLLKGSKSRRAVAALYFIGPFRQ
jgi:hypothetical protein